MTTLSTHVLDSARGKPAAGLEVTLDGTVTATTDADGRIGFPGELTPGDHTLDFATGAWFSAQYRDTFFPTAQVAFQVEQGRSHLHVALLLGPFSFTAYRGS